MIMVIWYNFTMHQETSEGFKTYNLRSLRNIISEWKLSFADTFYAVCWQIHVITYS